MNGKYNKAFAAAIAAIASILATQGIELSPEFQAAAVTVITTFAVWLIPNKAAQ